VSSKVKATVDEYITQSDRWEPELSKLRKILTSTELTEEVKWGAPCYTLDGKLVVGLTAFKEHVALWFHQGALLEDRDQVLINAQQGRTKALRQWRFTKIAEIKVRQIKSYLKEAIELQRAGRTVPIVRNQPVVVPAELKRALAADVEAKDGFDSLTPGKQREYADHIATAKRADTKEKRLAKILPMITEGKGLHDKYRKR